ncbi:MAG: hypothetical protein ABI867_26745 [Kofleriaceae bacterium]
MKLAALVVAGLAALAPTRADAKCGIPQWIGTPTGAAIPAKGTLYVWDEGLQYSDPKAATGAIKKKTKISDTVLALEYETKADELEITGYGYDAAPVYSVRPKWKTPAVAPRVLQYWHHVYSWTCSSSDSVMLQIDQPTAAFRVRWKFGGNKPREWIVPARTGDGLVSVLELGAIDCGTTTIDPAELDRGGELSVIAIRFDGSEVPVTGLPAVLTTKQMPVSEDGLKRAIAYQPGTVPPTMAFALPVDDDPDFALTVFMSVVVVLGALVFVRYRHRALKPVV